MSLYDFVHAEYPQGLGATYDVIERLIGERNDVLLLWTEVSKRPQGQRTDLVYNVHEVPEECSAGNSAAAGLRKLQKAAAEGNGAAQAALNEVVEGRKSVHGTCVESGLRKSTKIDPDVKARCSRSAAE